MVQSNMRLIVEMEQNMRVELEKLTTVKSCLYWLQNNQYSLSVIGLCTNSSQGPVHRRMVLRRKS